MRPKIATSLLAFAIIVSNVLGTEEVESADADEQIIDATIALARSYLGSDEALDAVETIRYRGAFKYHDGVRGPGELVFMKPSFQRLVSEIEGVREMSGYNATGGWASMESIADPSDRRVGMLDFRQSVVMRASIAEAFAFHARPTLPGAKVVHQGRAMIDGVECVSLVYDYGSNVWFIRYIDAETGRLVQSINNDDVVTRHVGEIIVDGIRFPERLITIVMSAEGVEYAMEFRYAEILLNEEIEESYFASPAL